MKVTEKTITFLFLRMSVHYGNFLPKNKEELDFMKTVYFEELKGYEEALIAHNFKRHLHSSNYLPTIADLTRPIEAQQKERYYIPTAKETRMLIEQKEAEMPKQKVDREFIRKQVQETMDKLEVIKREQYKRDFDPFK